MTRSDFAGTHLDLLVKNTPFMRPTAGTLTFWSAASGGTQYTDLVLNGSPVTSITVDSTGFIPTFQGPDGVTAMYADEGDVGGTRVKMVTISGPTDVGVAGFVGDTASLTRAALTGSYSRQAATGPFPALAGWYASLANAANEAVDVLIVGDSLMEGYQASSWANRRPVLDQAALRAKFPSGAAGGSGYIPAEYNFTGAAAVAWTRGGAAPTNQARGLGLRGRQMAATTTYTITQTCTSFELYIYRLSNDAVTITIDGGTPATWTLVTSGNQNQKWTSPALTPTSHTIVVTFVSGGPVFCGGMFYNGDETKGVRVWDGSTSGSKTSTYTTNASGSSTNWSEWIGSTATPGIAVTPDLVVLETLVNDVTTDDATTYATNMGALIDLVRTKTAAPILLMPHWKPLDRTITSPWTDYLEKLRGLAATKTNVAYFELQSRVPDLTGDPYSFLADAIHLNDKGQRFASSLDMTALAPSRTEVDVANPYSLPLRSGSWYTSVAGAVSASAGVNGRLALCPIYIAKPITVASLHAEVTTAAAPAGAAVTPCLYADDTTTGGWPGALVVSGGALDATTTGVKNSATLNVSIGKGWYWIGALITGATTTAPALRMNGASSSLGIPVSDATTALQNIASGTQQNSLSALPATFGGTVGAISGGFVPRVALKIA